MTRDQRRKPDNEPFNVSEVIKLVFDDIYMGKYREKCFIQPTHYTDHPILQMLFHEVSLNKTKNEKTCDDIFYEYLHQYQNQTNKAYFILMLKFVILFRECMNISKQKEVPGGKSGAEVDTSLDQPSPIYKKEYSSVSNAENAPELCNEFITEFMENNNYFKIEDEWERNEIIELIQHFCYWLHKNEYTQSKLSLLSC